MSSVSRKYDAWLQRLANMLLINAAFCKSTGLLHGKTGVALFLFHYARHTGDESWAVFAGNLLEQVSGTLDEDSAPGYADGMAGFGVGVEYLAEEQFLDADTDAVLLDLDQQMVHHWNHHAPETLWLDCGVTGFGRYFAARLRCPSRTGDVPHEALLRQGLGAVVDALHKPYDSYSTLYWVLDVLSESVPLQVHAEKALCYARYALDKLETMVREDIHFGLLPPGDELLSVCMAVMRAGQRAGIPEARDKATWLLDVWERKVTGQNARGAQAVYGQPADMLRRALNLHVLSEQLGESDLKARARATLERALQEQPHVPAGIPVAVCGNVPSLGLSQGYAGAGMALLTLSGACSSRWTELLSI